MTLGLLWHLTQSFLAFQLLFLTLLNEVSKASAVVGYICVHERTYMPDKSQWITCCSICTIHFFFFLSQSLTGLEPAKQDRLTIKSLVICLSPLSQIWNYKCVGTSDFLKPVNSGI